jgi:hypothetical protein
MPQEPCRHPYFSEAGFALAAIGVLLALGLLVLAALIWITTRRRSPAGPVAALGVLSFLASRATGHWGDALIMRLGFGADDWTRLQHELQAHEADLAQYSREHAGLTTPLLVKGYLATHSLPAFQFTKPSVPPLDFKVSDWRHRPAHRRRLRLLQRRRLQLGEHDGRTERLSDCPRNTLSLPGLGAGRSRLTPVCAPCARPTVGRGHILVSGAALGSEP